MDNDNVFVFLKSTRFWALIVGSVATAILMVDATQLPLWLSIAAHSVQIASGGFIGIRTADRITDKMAEK